MAALRKQNPHVALSDFISISLWFHVIVFLIANFSYIKQFGALPLLLTF